MDQLCNKKKYNGNGNIKLQDKCVTSDQKCSQHKILEKKFYSTMKL